MSNVFGSRLRQLRKEKRMTMKELGAKFGLAESTISGYETGIRNPDMTLIARFSEFFNVSTDYLLGTSDESPIDKSDKKSDNSTYNTTDAYNALVRGFGEDNVIPTGVVNVPIVAEISCGEPIFTEDAILGFVPMGTALLLGADISDYIFLRASGDSMIEADIKDGSFVLIRKQNVADNGDIVAVCIGNENATLKRIYFNGEHVVLAAENPRYMPMTYHGSEVRIVGKAVMVTKSL